MQRFLLTISDKVLGARYICNDLVEFGADQTRHCIGAVKLMRTRIGLLAQPKSMRSIIDATQREQWHGLA
jgi:hypothetical protein